MTWLRGCLLGLLLPVLAAPVRADERTGAEDAFDLFTQACLHEPVGAAATQAWATSHHLAAVSNPRGLQVFTGDPHGVAWQILDRSTPLVLAIRATSGGCAVFAERADPASLTARFERLIATERRGPHPVERLPDKSAPGPFGARVMRIAIESLSKETLRIFMLLTDERPGGPFQATLQVGGGQR